jgi:hypothetical protein
MSTVNGAIVVTRHGRTTPLQRWTDHDFYAALVVFGARESVAAAAAKGLITVKTRAH